MSLRRYRPSVPRAVLVLLAGATWTVVGLMLLRLAAGWLVDAPRHDAAPAGTAGLVAGMIAARWGFLRIARRNVDRLLRLGDPACIFAFQAWRSWILVAGMIALGVTLRHSALPRTMLAFFYAAMGGALALASLAYYPHVGSGRRTRATP